MWLIFGLRYVVGDDVILSLQEKLYPNEAFEIADRLAKEQGRLIFYPKILIYEAWYHLVH